MKTKIKIFISILSSIIVLVLGVAIGSVYVEPLKILTIIFGKILSQPISADLNENLISIIWDIRLPRVLAAFLVGGALAASGTVMQSILKNPLASSYTLGVSSGASVGVGLVLITGFSIPVLGNFTLPLIGLLSGLVTVYLVITITAQIDRNMGNTTIILFGMNFSLFINAVTTLIMALSRETLPRLIYWQMGSFALKSWLDVKILAVIFVGCYLILIRYTNELDIMTFGEEQALAIGVEAKKVKWILLILSAALTGSAVAFTGVIGFIDLIAPHVVRKIFGSSHKLVVPISILFGGTFMVACDLVARILVSNSELPVGAVTALIGAPFFAYVYFKNRKVR
ncbi:MAG TPA: iron ABC transporter permease [Defluviitaleaceae bacterium]|jgi:iron complex transport system permease protein|nr:iron ABC transporter permease [Defluviitaleaceae bacterium]HPT76636.1 iron ABC transporter permease [Defluviitaleaceae bacterium]